MIKEGQELTLSYNDQHLNAVVLKRPKKDDKNYVLLCDGDEVLINRRILECLYYQKKNT